ncbi:unnamed protein product (macronuclear) [Paramecium tetraurelia]|uniref:Uncharacterized protein n=1 Tax=Paramecium tetraurelia TaxID=5888 RepID=A0E2V3_PARTE|nr:uncharacterized protein GSPATT00022792001 [Paramecium tetraurelia]CAK89620.1 unnamed protein product [Paramecium tetraurelia]|eukprot:XP_001457017.1 hypothetical protein (macronuclear) [Paramecium tetraurelia strain d4-2]
MKIGLQQRFTICNLIASILFLIFGLTQHINTLDSGLFIVVDLIFSLTFLLLDCKQKFICLTGDYYLALTQLVMQIVQVEMTIITQQKGIFIFIVLKLLALTKVLRVQMLQKLIYFIVLTYSIIRFNEYSYPISYLGLIFTPILILQEQSDESDLLRLFKEILPLPLLVIDKSSRKPIYHTKALENEYKYNTTHSEEFIECLNHFFSDNKLTLQNLFDNSKDSLYNPQNRFRSIFTEIMDNCQYLASSPLFQEFRNIGEVNNDIEDQMEEQKKQEFDQHPEIMIETPKYQQFNRIPIQLSEESPKNKKSKIMEELLIQSQSLKHKCVSELKKKRLKLFFNHCFWNKNEAFLLIFQNKEIEKSLTQIQQQLSEQKQICENKDLILASVFHDFKTPINGIVTILETLESKQDLNPEEKYFLSIIRKNVYLMLYMIYDIQDYARIEKNQLRLCPSDFYINELIDEVIETIAISAEQKGVEIKTCYDIPFYQVHSDPNRIKQIIMNIISNSLKFTEKGSITITVQSLNTDKSLNIKRNNSSKNISFQNSNQSISQIRKSLQGRHPSIAFNKLVYTISIEDTGCGIADSVKPKLFNLFATFSSQKIENKNGTGIGLMVCKKLVSLLGPSDTIDLQSEVNVGTKMTFQIYAKLQDNPNRTQNYVSCFKQENSSQHLSNFQNEESPYSKDKPYQQSLFVRSSYVRLYTKPLEKAETEMYEPSLEDADHTKSKNILQLQSLSQKTSLQRCLQSQDPLEVQDPKVLIQQLVQSQKFGILIVDDQTFNVIAFKMLLQNLIPQADIIEAFNGQQAILKLQEHQKSLNIKYVFMDLQMPILNGWQAAEKIRKMINNKEIASIKLIALSGFDDESQQEKCEKLGFDAFLSKPIRIEMISEVFYQLEKSFD